MKDIVSKTLLIPLYCRALEAKSKKPILNDEFAIKILENFNEDELKYLNYSYFTRGGVIARAYFFDKLARDFIEKNDSPVIVNMAAGLDSRSLRIWSKKAKFFDIDLPEVIEIRKKYIEDKSTLIATDIFDFNYIEQLRKFKNHQFCFIFEGFLMYFDKERLQMLFKTINENFSGTIMGDFVFGDYWAKNQNKHDAMKNNKAKFALGYNSLEEFLQFNSSFKIKYKKYYHSKEFLKFMGYRGLLMKFMPKKIRNSFMLLAFDF
ncbi:SAM-dependent methyltransferase [Campylobacter blaseri]|uniref:Methyltransferase n=1 Tax=Campylobacter blaseri TaxID=2042961 RepID=A0A2P8R1A9_9BACT|nr:class I SAM-dependent methyltransferase [Campylobacter blaseri]PSM52280.1 hypothetical protein CQ405_04295 [Campylobacter blaseri]PSM54046.1 hypothetical protein CRN67_04295 [Campylobacter blaseri]QKF85487.1 SAM-dependent methyltransferase [Campylobacter blaseri]